MLPQGEEEIRSAPQACPVAAIGAPPELVRRTPANGFPALITRHRAGDVDDRGLASRRSVGASSWLVVRPGGNGMGGNVLIDSPRWSLPLARRIAELGDLAEIVLSHRDHVADHARWAEHFACPRWIHAADADAAPGAEQQVEDREPVMLDPDLTLFPTPGHTAGSMVVVLGQRAQVLFSGDHLWWQPALGEVVASRRSCWWNWQEQVRSVQRLLDLDVAGLLPGHGDRQASAPGEWRAALTRTLTLAKGG